MFSFQPAGVNGAELNAPKTDRFTTDSNASLGQQIFDVPVAQIEAIVEQHCVGNDVRRKSVSFIDIHSPILSASAL